LRPAKESSFTKFYFQGQPKAAKCSPLADRIAKPRKSRSKRLTWVYKYRALRFAVGWHGDFGFYKGFTHWHMSMSSGAGFKKV